MISKIQKFIYFTLITCGLCTSCDTDEITPSKDFGGLEYFPLEQGEVTNFVISEISYTIFGTDTINYFTKEKVLSIKDSNNTKTAYIEISKSNTLHGTYNLSNLTSITINDNHIIQNKENVIFLKAAIPLEKGKLFDQNLYNQLDEKLALIKQMNETVSTTNFKGEYTFNNALNIVFEENTNTIDNILKHQIYEKNKGLMYELNQEINQQPQQLPIGYKKLKIRL